MNLAMWNDLRSAFRFDGLPAARAIVLEGEAAASRPASICR
jgi:hypothetical protein